MRNSSGSTDEDLYRQLVEFAGDVIYRADMKGRFTYCNRMALSLLGYSADEILGHPYLEIVHPEFRYQTARFYGRQFVRRKPDTYYEFVCLARDGTEFWLGQNVQLLEKDGELCGFQAIARDITERKKMEERLAYEASHDSLTGIPNRRYFSERLQSCFEELRTNRKKPLSICICDVDRFKLINDKHGHAAGDEVLRSVGLCLRQNVRNLDIVGRIAGDEFGILLPGTAGPQAVLCIERIRDRLETLAFVANDEVYSVTASFGVARAADGMTPHELLAAADLALYAAKAAGRNRTAIFAAAI